MEENQPNNFVISRRGGHDHELPQDILEEIIVRLPEKSIVRFKSVCRQWFNMISYLDIGPLELKFRRSISKLRIVHLNFSAQSKSVYSLFKLDERGLKAKKVATFSLWDASNYHHTIKLSCDGLLLLLGSRRRVYVYDTIKQQRKLLPEFPVGKLHGRVIYHTMVYDASKGNYKVLIFFGNKFEGMKLFLYDLDPQKLWRKGNWRKSTPPLAQIIVEHSSIVVVQGVLYWIAEKSYNPFDIYCFIQPMEIATEKFMKRIEAPRQPVQVPSRGLATYELLEMEGSLCLVHAASGEKLNIWARLKDSVQSFWIKLYNIVLSSILHRPPSFDEGNLLVPSYFHPLLIVENRILVSNYEVGLYWYNMDTKELSEITMEADPDCNPVIYIHSILLK